MVNALDFKSAYNRCVFFPALPGHESPMKSQIPSGPIEITLDDAQIMRKRYIHCIIGTVKILD
jgi:hypothetical protein